MKLPEDPKERIKVLALVGVGGVGVIYALIAGILRPLSTRKVERLEQIAEMKEKLELAQRDVGRMLRDRAQNTKMLQEIIENASRKGYILRPRLGNYILGAREFVDRNAHEAAVEVTDVREIGIMQIPQPPLKKIDNSLKSYNVRVSLEGGLHHCVRLLSRLEESNPMACISSLSISSRSAEPALHHVSFELQLPVWVDPTMDDKLAQRLAEVLDDARANPRTPGRKDAGETEGT